MIYPTFDNAFKFLDKENIIVANANDTLRNQQFRIYYVSKQIANKVEVYARHISYDLMYDFIEAINIEKQSCEYALNTIFRNSHFCKHFKGYSNIINAQNFKIEMVDCLSALAGAKGSIIDTFGTGAELLRDNTNINVLNRRGHDNSVTIEYAKNLTGFECTEDTTDLITRIYAYAKYTPEGGSETVVSGGYIDSNYIYNYSHPYIKEIDFSEKFEEGEVPTTEKIRNFAKKYFEDNKCDIPKLNYKIEFIPLSKCAGYKDLEDKISLCDTVTIKHKIYGIETQVKVIKTVFNVIKDRYESMELGEPRTSLNDVIGGGNEVGNNNSSSSGSGSGEGIPGPQGPAGPQGPQGPQGIPGTPGTDGKTYYTWIRYADDEYGNGMSNLPVGKDYIGIAYNKETRIESTNPRDYTWSKYTGDQGIPGKPGTDGKIYYTWVKYADDEFGNGMSDSSLGKEYLGIAYNKETQQESNNPRDYTWTKIKGDQGIPGTPGTDGKTYYTWVKYADDELGNGMSDDPTGKKYLGIAYNKETQQESNNPRDYEWIKIKGEDGNIGNFPNSLPATPILSYKLYGFANIELSWTFENKVYYSYELYASKNKGFTPNTFDLIHAGQSSSYLFQAKPNETWYFKVCAINSYGNRTAFSSEVAVTTKKIDDFEDYFSTLAVENLVTSIFSADYMEAGIIKGHWIDARQLSVTDGNGKRTLDIDSFGNVRLDVTTLSISAKSVATQSYADTKMNEAISSAASDATAKANNALNNAKTYTNTQITEAKSEIKITTDGITQNVSNVTKTTETLKTDLNTAKSLAESKAKVFTSTPVPPYKVGDLWVTGSNGDFMKCKVARTTGSYNANDWEKATKYTDDTKANQVAGELDITKNKVSTNESSINILKDQISSKVSQTDVDRTVANIQVGGRNLVKNSDVLQNLLSTAGGYAGTRTVVNDSAAKSGKHIQFKCTTAGSGFHLPLFPKTADKIGKTYTWSFWAKGSVNKNGNVGHECGGHANIALTTEWKKFSHTWKYTDATYHSFTFYLNWNVNEIMYIRDFKIEEGNKATDWTPAPEDTDKLIADNIKVVTDKISNVSSELNQTKNSITASVSSLTTKTTTIETNLNNTTKDLTGKINTAKTEAISAAANDATSKANNALNDAKSYTNTQITEAKASIKITTDSISSEVSKKVNSNQVISSINQTSESVKIKANKIQLEGSTTIGDSENRHIKIDKANYSIYRGDRKLGYFGVVDDEKNGHPKLTLGHNGIRVENDDYLTLHAYGGGGNNAEGNSSAYCDFAYHSIKFKDWSNIKMYGNGDIKLAPIKDLIISTNYSDGSYGGEGENKVAMFAGSTSQYYKGNLQIGAVRNMTNSYGLVLTDDHADNKCAVRVNVDSNGSRFFRPLTTDGNIELGSGGYKWKKVHSVNGVSYSVRDNSLEPAAICMMDNSIDTALDTLNFSMNFQRGHNKRSTDEIQLELDISQLKDHELSNMFLNITEEECEDGEILTSTSADMTSLLHLALYELQKQKEEIKTLKEEIKKLKVDIGAYEY